MPEALFAIEAEQQQLQAILPTSCVRWLTESITPAMPDSLTFQPYVATRTVSRHGLCFLSVMYTKTTFFRRLTRLLTGSLATLCLLMPGVRTLADAFTLPEQLIGVTQGFLEFTVEDYLASTQTAGRYEIEVSSLDPRLRMPLCSQQLDAAGKPRAATGPGDRAGALQWRRAVDGIRSRHGAAVPRRWW